MGLSQQPYLHSYRCDKPADLLKANMALQNFAMGMLSLRPRGSSAESTPNLTPQGGFKHEMKPTAGLVVSV